MGGIRCTFCSGWIRRGRRGGAFQSSDPTSQNLNLNLQPVYLIGLAGDALQLRSKYVDVTLIGLDGLCILACLRIQSGRDCVDVSPHAHYLGVHVADNLVELRQMATLILDGICVVLNLLLEPSKGISPGVGDSRLRMLGLLRLLLLLLLWLLLLLLLLLLGMHMRVLYRRQMRRLAASLPCMAGVILIDGGHDGRSSDTHESEKRRRIRITEKQILQANVQKEDQKVRRKESPVRFR